MRCKGIFVTGTDTGVGKTAVCAGIVRLAIRRGLRAAAVKPIETGCLWKDGILYPEDGVLLRTAAREALSLEDCAPHRFELPASPARAAELEGVELNPIELENHIRSLESERDFLIVEGAGGLMVPISKDLLTVDFIERLGYPVLLVARTRLGTVNHTLLSIEALVHRAIPVAGIVLSQTQLETGPEESFTPSDIAGLVKEIPVAVVPFLGEKTRNPDSVADILENWPKELLDEIF